MWIVCLADNSNEIPSFIFSEKVRVVYATLELGALSYKHFKWAFKHQGVKYSYLEPETYWYFSYFSMNAYVFGTH